MSILLEALRKSEKSQRAHGVPTIHADDEVATVSETLATGPLALLLVLALFMSGWIVWHQYQTPAPATEPSVASTPEPASEIPEPAGASQSPTATASVSSDAKTTQLKSSSTVADKSAIKPRTPVETYKSPVKSAPETKPAGTDRVAAPPPIVDESAKKPVAIAPPEPRREMPRPISYWELPDSVRAIVPEIKFSVLVYAANPSDRFVLINGERLLEGDNAGSDLLVKEIRRDGVLFSYRKYQFLVER
jgi:general secretion pathway protein B